MFMISAATHPILLRTVFAAMLVSLLPSAAVGATRPSDPWYLQGPSTISYTGKFQHPTASPAGEIFFFQFTRNGAQFSGEGQGQNWKTQLRKQIYRFTLSDISFGSDCHFTAGGALRFVGTCGPNGFVGTVQGNGPAFPVSLPRTSRILGPAPDEIEQLMAAAFVAAHPNAATMQRDGLLTRNGNQVSYGLPPTNGTLLYQETYTFRVNQHDEPVCRSVGSLTSCALQQAIGVEVDGVRERLAEQGADLLSGKSGYERDREARLRVERRAENPDADLSFVPVTYSFSRTVNGWTSAQISTDMAALVKLLERRRDAAMAGRASGGSDPAKSLCQSLGTGVMAGGGDMSGPAGRAYKSLGC